MRIKNNAKNGLLISIVIVIVALAILLVVNTIPNTDINTLNATNKFINVNKGETPIWKIVCYIIVGILLFLSTIVNFIMCRCHFCRSHIHFMNIFTMYCPYCSKSLNNTK